MHFRSHFFTISIDVFSILDKKRDLFSVLIFVKFPTDPCTAGVYGGSTSKFTKSKILLIEVVRYNSPIKIIPLWWVDQLSNLRAAAGRVGQSLVEYSPS